MDDRKQRIVIDRASRTRHALFGWESPTGRRWMNLPRGWKSWREVPSEPRTLADARRVRGLISFHDPAGNRLEAFHGADIDDTPFSPGRSISGFDRPPRAGHAVLTVENIDPRWRSMPTCSASGFSD